MTDTVDTAGSIARMTRAAAAIGSLRGSIEAGQPWPMGPLAADGPETAWGPLEVLAHTAEGLQYWLGEIERVLAGAPEPVPFGRIASDPLRTLTIERDRSLPSGELINRIQSTVARYAARLPDLSAADWNRRGLHPRLGEMTVAAMLERFVVTHLEEHATQLTEAVRSRAAGS